MLVLNNLHNNMHIESLEHLEAIIKSEDNHKNQLICSNIPEVCKIEQCMVGIDEAGRGPVLGPMVYGLAYCPVEKTKVLEDLGCADSKALNEEKRDDIFSKMLSEELTHNCVGWVAEVISPNFICNSMYRRSKCSLNEVSMNSAIGLIRNIAQSGVNISEVYVDTVGPPEKYQAKLSELFPTYKITVAKKADSIYPVVSAASIVAKVTRDHALKVWKFPEGLEMDYKEFGSGYPGDPLTKKFIRERVNSVFGYPQLVRFSWSTAELMLKEKASSCTFDEEEEESAAKKPARPISSFFTSKSEDKKVRKRHRFFRERYLTVEDPFA